MQASLGILGLGRRSTQFYIDELDENGHPFFQTDFESINAQLPDNHLIIKELLTPVFEQIKASEVTHLLVPNITLHKVLDEMDFPFSLIHPIELMKKALQNAEKPVMIIGTRHTSKDSFVGKAVYDSGTILTPTPPTIIQQADELRLAVYNGSETEVQIGDFNATIAELAAKATPVIACTELSVVSRIEGPIDLGRLQIESALTLI